jgi:hypothetical protein
MAKRRKMKKPDLLEVRSERVFAISILERILMSRKVITG